MTIQLALYIMVAVIAGGLAMAAFSVNRRPVPRLFRIGHEVAALLGMTALLLANLSGPTEPRAWWALAVFAAGFFGGLTLFRFVFRGRTPLVMIFGHGSLGLVGLVLLYGALP
jgi:hypothetical protein